MQNSINQMTFEIKNLLGQGKTKEAIELLKISNFTSYTKEITLISNRWEDFKRKKVLGLLSLENGNILRNHINHDIFELIQLIEEEQSEVNKTKKSPILAIIFFVLIAGGSYLFFNNPVTIIEVEETAKASREQKEEPVVIETNSKVVPTPPSSQNTSSILAEIIASCEKAKSDDHDSYHALDIGKCIIENGYFNEGIQYALRAFDEPMEDTRKAGAYVTLSKYYEEANYYNEAIAQMNKALEIKPNFQRFEKRLESLKALKYASK